MHINKVIILMHYYAYYEYKQSYYTYALLCIYTKLSYLCIIMLIMHINKVIILLRYYAYKQSYHTYALLCLLCI